MKISATGLALVKAFEGCHMPVPGRPGVFRAYRCPAGVVTIGWGHTSARPPAIQAGEVWDQLRCDEVLLADLVDSERRVARALAGARLAQHEFDALVSFDFNTGGITRSSIPAKILAGRRQEVAATLLRWSKAGGRELAGLTRRRRAEAALFNGDAAGALRIAGAAAPAPGPQRVDRPSAPPPRAELGVAAGGAGVVATAPLAGGEGADHPLLLGGLLLGAVLLAAGLVIAWSRHRRRRDEWA